MQAKMPNKKMAEFIEQWHHELDQFIAKHHDELVQALSTKSSIGNLLRCTIEEIHQRKAQNCLFDYQRWLFHRARAMPSNVADLYGFTYTKFRTLCYDDAVQKFDYETGLDAALLAFEHAFPLRTQVDVPLQLQDRASSTCLNQHLEASTLPHRFLQLQHSDHHLISSIWWSLAQLPRDDQNRPLIQLLPQFRAVPYLICPTCPQTPFARSKHIESSHDHQDLMYAQGYCQNYIESKLGAKR
jgi:hypothetical protein